MDPMGLGRSTKACVSPCVTLRNSSVLFGVNGGPCNHSRLQNLPSSSFVLGDPVGQWARNLGAWHDTRTGGTRWDVMLTEQRDAIGCKHDFNQSVKFVELPHLHQPESLLWSI